jgi:Rho guanine nucleotide exchange factor 10
MQRNFSMQQDHSGTINAMAHSGVGLWISLRHSSTICLYHTETFRHLQDINVASNVNRLVGKKHSRDVHVTALMASKGLLWVGTNVGIALSIPLPRLEGVPIISGRANVSHHAHSGPINVFLTMQMQSKPTNSPPYPSVSIPLPSSLPPSGTIQEESENESTSPRSKPLASSINQLTTSHFNTVPKVRSPLLDSPLVLRRRSKESSPLLGKRMSRTLPRGHVSAATECDIFGLYGELMNIKDFDEGNGSGLMCGGSGTGAGAVNSMYETLRRSDPDLAAIPAKVSTLDRRLHMKAGRPRSLDLSNWSVDSRSSLYTSSGSEDSASQQMTPSATMLTIRQTSTLKHSQQHNTSTSKSSVDTPRTVLTLSGGCGYLYTHQRYQHDGERKNSVPSPANINDAHIILWEMKL